MQAYLFIFFQLCLRWLLLLVQLFFLLSTYILYSFCVFCSSAFKWKEWMSSFLLHSHCFFLQAMRLLNPLKEEGYRKLRHVKKWRRSTGRMSMSAWGLLGASVLQFICRSVVSALGRRSWRRTNASACVQKARSLRTMSVTWMNRLSSLKPRSVSRKVRNDKPAGPTIRYR